MTDSLPLAAFLVAHGVWLSNAESDADGRFRFVFRDSADCSRLEWQFRRAPKAMIDARTFAYALDELKDRANRLRHIRRT